MASYQTLWGLAQMWGSAGTLKYPRPLDWANGDLEERWQGQQEFLLTSEVAEAVTATAVTFFWSPFAFAQFGL